MAGAIIENMSTRKLVLFVCFILLLQICSIMVGALISPSPTTAIRYLATKCIDRHRTRAWLVPWGSNRCQQVHSFDEPLAKTLDANDVVFAVHVPLPNKEMSPWFQYLLAVLQFDIAFKMINQIEDDVVVTVDARLAFRDDTTSEWTSKFHSVERRPLRCTFAVPKVNLRDSVFCTEINHERHGEPSDGFPLPQGIHQNGGFTKVWVSMKTVFSPWMLVATVWYWDRIRLMARPPVLLEKVIFALGLSVTFLNMPVEWLSMGFEWTWMLLFEDAQQGAFYSTLFCFWIIFCGEHLMDQRQRNRLSAYQWQVGLVVFGSSVLLIFDLSERGVHLSNPFYSVWASDSRSKPHISFITVAGISVCLYFLSLCRMVCCVLRTIGGKMQQLPAMPEARRLRYKGIIFRFRFLMLVTLTCAAVTVIFFILNQVSEGHWHWGDFTLQVHSAFLTGIYGMWNLYVFTIIFLYAPSHKHRRSESGDTPHTGLTCGEQGPTEVYRITGKVAEE
uniref:Wnt ligand secretion mediator n=1 Tax=Amphilophus citrinellus TaxID=61819 RepID=A0A3Q0S673_AMPCI